TAVSSSANPTVWGQSVTFTATVSVTAPGVGTPTGSVTFLDGGTSIGSGTLDTSLQVTLTTANLSVGGHSITASYVGDGNFNGSSSSIPSQAVNKASTTTTVASSLNASTYGDLVTFTATVTANSPSTINPSSTGSVTVKDGTTTLCSAVA